MEFNIQVHNSPIDFYRNGKAFMESSWRCYGKEENGEYKIVDDGRICQLTAPAVVNAAFACEMFLKALLKHYEIEYKREHNLIRLFDLLPEYARNKISYFCGASKDGSQFRKALSEHADDFVDIRYYVENNDWGRMSPTYMITLAYNMSEITKWLLANSSSNSNELSID